MKKLFNVMGAASFAMSGAIVTGAVVAYIRVPAMAKKYVSDMKLELTKTILDAVPVPEIPKMPKLPTKTGPAIPFK